MNNGINLEEIYRVWFAYLIHCDEFIEYIRLAYHNNVDPETLPEKIQQLKGYADDWITPLLPDLWTRFPTMSDFVCIWSRFERHISMVKHGGDININFIPELNEDIKSHLPSILHQMTTGDKSPDDVVDWVSGTIENSALRGPVIQIPSPAVYPKRDSLKQIEDLFSSFPDLRNCQVGSWFDDDEPVRFRGPAINFDDGSRIDNLSSYKRDLTWYILFKKELSPPDLFYGNGIKKFMADLPFKDEGINFTDQKYESGIAVRLRSGNTDPHRTYRYRSSAQKEDREIKEFIKWAQTCASRARATMDAVAQGWFPKIPTNR
nr:hypothetical protein [uncultured Desulfuromonas sp.]